MYTLINKKNQLYITDSDKINEMKLNYNCPDSEKVGTGPGSCGGNNNKEKEEKNSSNQNQYEHNTNGYINGKLVKGTVFANIPINSSNRYHPINDMSYKNVAWAEVFKNPSGGFTVKYDIYSKTKNQVVKTEKEANQLAKNYINSKKAIDTSKPIDKSKIINKQTNKQDKIETMDINQIIKELKIHEDTIDSMKNKYSNMHEDTQDNMVESDLREMYRNKIKNK